jgi:hypothetical protein
VYIYIYRSLSIRNLPSIPILRPGVTRTSTDFLFLRLTCVVEDLWIFSSDEDVVVYPPHSDIQNTNIIIVILCSMFVPYMLTVYVPCMFHAQVNSHQVFGKTWSSCSQETVKPWWPSLQIRNQQLSLSHLSTELEPQQIGTTSWKCCDKRACFRPSTIGSSF